MLANGLYEGVLPFDPESHTLADYVPVLSLGLGLVSMVLGFLSVPATGTAAAALALAGIVTGLASAAPDVASCVATGDHLSCLAAGLGVAGALTGIGTLKYMAEGFAKDVANGLSVLGDIGDIGGSLAAWLIDSIPRSSVHPSPDEVRP